LPCPCNRKVYTDFADGVKETKVLRLLIDLTPFIPLSLKGEGEGLVLKGFHPFNLPHLTKGEGESSKKRG